MKNGRQPTAKVNATYIAHVRAAKASRRPGAVSVPPTKSVTTTGTMRLKDILSELPQLVWATDKTGRCIYVNRAFEDFTGAVADSLMNASWTTFLHPHDLAGTTTDWVNSVRYKTVHQTQYRIRRHDNTYRWMLARAVMVQDEDGRPSHWVGTNTDVHELHQAMEATRKSRALEQEFMRSWLHDLRIPLGIVELKAELALGHLDEHRRVAQSLRAIIQDVGRLDTMVAELLDDESVPHETYAGDGAQPTDLRNIVSCALKKCHPDFSKRLVVEITEQCVPGAWNPRALHRVLESLLDNATRYGHPNGPIKLSLTCASGHATIAVHNQLPATDARAAPTSEPDKNAERTQCSVPRGWGLGLPTVKRIAEDHGGFVEVESATDQGTTVRVVLPLTQAL